MTRSLERRLADLERRIRAAGGEPLWSAPLLTVDVDTDDEEIERRLQEMREAAEAVGWCPESGRPFVVVVELS